MKRMPGFSADASLHETRGRYADGGSPASTAGSPSHVVPQDTVDDILEGACGAACSAACVTAIIGGYKNWTECLKACARDFGC